MNRIKPKDGTLINGLIKCCQMKEALDDFWVLTAHRLSSYRGHMPEVIIRAKLVQPYSEATAVFVNRLMTSIIILAY
jgi:hypothetical protein